MQEELRLMLNVCVYTELYYTDGYFNTSVFLRSQMLQSTCSQACQDMEQFDEVFHLLGSFSFLVVKGESK